MILKEIKMERAQTLQRNVVYQLSRTCKHNCYVVVMLETRSLLSLLGLYEIL